MWTNVAQPNGDVLVLLGSGNLQFLAGGDNSLVVWESFRHPTDTLFPAQSMGAGAILRSKRTDAGFSSGRFGLFVQPDGNIVLFFMNLAVGGKLLNTTWTASPYLMYERNGFRDDRLLGQGSFGKVYRGVVNSLRPPDMAVKKLTVSNECIEREFVNEVQSIGQIHHRNLVRMVGYCKEREQRMLVFEFMPRGSLESVLFQPETPWPWSWHAEAALGIAKGIEHLHERCRSPIIHYDIKPDNILLDDNNNPKITDFGIAGLLGDEQGTLPPKWFRADRSIDTKVDVYSFGVMLLEMICC